MFGISSFEFLLILLVALVVLGPEKLPKILRTATKVMSEFRRIKTDFHRVVNTELAFQEQQEREQKQKQLERSIQAKIEAEREVEQAAKQKAAQQTEQKTKSEAVHAEAGQQTQQKAELVVTQPNPEQLVEQAAAHEVEQAAQFTEHADRCTDEPAKQQPKPEEAQ